MTDDTETGARMIIIKIIRNTCIMITILINIIIVVKNNYDVVVPVLDRLPGRDSFSCL